VLIGRYYRSVDVGLTLQAPFRFLRAVLARFKRDDGFRLSASLSYTTLLAIVPVAAVALGVFAAFPAFEHFTDTIQQFLAKNLLPAGASSRILEYIDQFARNAARLTAIGLVFVAVTAFVLIGTIDKAFNDIWRVRRTRPVALRALLYWGVMTLGPVVVGASLTITSYALATLADTASRLPWANGFLLWFVPFVLMTGVLTLLYLTVPHKHVEWRHALAGAIAAAIVFEVLKRGFGAYLAYGPNYATVYGTLAVIPIFLVWIYASWVVVVLGAEIAALAPDYHHASLALAERARPSFREALAALAVLIRAQADSRPASTRRISREGHLATEMAEVVMDELARGGLVARVGGDRWTLVCDPDRMTLAEARRRFMHERALADADDPITSALADLERSTDRALGRPLRALVPPPITNAPAPAAPAQPAPAPASAPRADEVSLPN
jgi:membrane protein